jgi:signal transduction histidine kinase
MSEGLSSPSGARETVRPLSGAPGKSVLATLPAVAAGIAATVISLHWRSHLTDTNLRACVETSVALLALLASALLTLQIRRRARRQDVLLLSALISVGLTDFVFLALPTLVGVHLPAYGIDARLLVQGLVPLVFLAAAVSGAPGAIRWSGRRSIAIGSACLAAVAAIEALDLVIGRSGASGQVGSDLVIALAVVEAAIFVIAAVAFIWLFAADKVTATMLGSASLLLAGVRLQALAIATVPADWVTLRDVLRVAAYGLLLAAIGREFGLQQRAEARNALSAERERIARDIHDGLAQDLATIALHAQHLRTSLGDEHPLTVAARRALASSRETIVDLSASHADTTSAAIRVVADELEARFAIAVTVNDRIDTDHSGHDLAPRVREQAVRIAREAIVNAARHGGAKHVEVTLEGSDVGSLVLRIADDGSGIEPDALASSTGFGLRTMRARAAELGAEFTARPQVSGGTVLELSMAVRRARR